MKEVESSNSNLDKQVLCQGRFEVGHQEGNLARVCQTGDEERDQKPGDQTKHPSRTGSAIRADSKARSPDEKGGIQGSQA